jgi:hypothetical protein
MTLLTRRLQGRTTKQMSVTRTPMARVAAAPLLLLLLLLLLYHPVGTRSGTGIVMYRKVEPLSCCPWSECTTVSVLSLAANRRRDGANRIAAVWGTTAALGLDLESFILMDSVVTDAEEAMPDDSNIASRPFIMCTGKSRVDPSANNKVAGRSMVPPIVGRESCRRVVDVRCCCSCCRVCPCSMDVGIDSCGTEGYTDDTLGMARIQLHANSQHKINCPAWRIGLVRRVMPYEDDMIDVIAIGNLQNYGVVSSSSCSASRYQRVQNLEPAVLSILPSRLSFVLHSCQGTFIRLSMWLRYKRATFPRFGLHPRSIS